MNIDISKLKELAFYLEGLRDGQGNLFPFGEAHLDALWAAIKHLGSTGSTSHVGKL